MFLSAVPIIQMVQVPIGSTYHPNVKNAGKTSMGQRLAKKRGGFTNLDILPFVSIYLSVFISKSRYF